MNAAINKQANAIPMIKENNEVNGERGRNNSLEMIINYKLLL